MASRGKGKKRARGAAPNRPPSEDDDSPDEGMPALARQEDRQEGPDDEAAESGGESQPPDIGSDDDSYEDEDLVQFLLDLEADEAEDEGGPVGWKEVDGPTQIKVDDFDPGIDHPGPRHNLDYQSKALDFFHLFLMKIFSRNW